MADFSGYDKKRLMKFRALHPKQTTNLNRCELFLCLFFFKMENHYYQVTFFNFDFSVHMLVLVPLDNNGLVKYGVPTIHEIKKARFYQLRVEDDLEAIRQAENSCKCSQKLLNHALSCFRSCLLRKHCG